MSRLNQKRKIIALAALALAALGVWLLAPQREPGFVLPKTYSENLEINLHQLTLGIQPVGAAASLRVVDALTRKVVYPDAYQATDIELTEEPGRKIKEDIILKQPGHPQVFRYKLQGLEKFITEFDSKGNLVFYRHNPPQSPLTLRGGDRGVTELERVLTIPAPLMIDSQGQPSSTDDVEITLQNDLLTITPSQEWLESHTYPIILDPTLEISVLNINSVPTVGGPWEVRFTTIGKGDLIIQGDPENTVYGEHVEAVSLKCGSQDLTNNILKQVQEDNRYVYEGWSCNETAVWTARVLKPGHHHQTFTFMPQGRDKSRLVPTDWV